jgi:hypothetical protein
MLVDYTFGDKKILGAEVKLLNTRKVGTNHSAWVHLVKDGTKHEEFFVSADTEDESKSTEDIIFARMKSLTFLSNFSDAVPETKPVEVVEVKEVEVTEQVAATPKKKGRGKKNSA